jgi:hypothetical protein
MASFVFAPGPITWIYMSEVMNYKGVAAGTAINWLFELIIGLISKPMLESEIIGDYVFMIFAGTYTLATIIIFIFLRETKGLSEAQVSRLYVR